MGAALRDLGPAASGAGVGGVETDGVRTGTSASPPVWVTIWRPTVGRRGWYGGASGNSSSRRRPRPQADLQPLAQEGHEPHVGQAGGPHDTDEQDQSQGQSGPDRIEAGEQDGRQETPEVAAAVVRAVAPPQGQQPRRGQQDPQAREGLEPAQVLQPLVVRLPGQAQEHQRRPIGGQAQQPEEAMGHQDPGLARGVVDRRGLPQGLEPREVNAGVAPEGQQEKPGQPQQQQGRHLLAQPPRARCPRARPQA